MGSLSAAPRALSVSLLAVSLTVVSLLSGCGSVTPPTGIEGPESASTVTEAAREGTSSLPDEPAAREPLRPDSGRGGAQPEVTEVVERSGQGGRADASAPGLPALSGTVAILPLGDSITQGDSEHDTWRRPLYLELRARGYDVDFVGSEQEHEGGSAPSDDFDHDHEGHWGYRADELLAELGDWVQGYVPDVVLLHAGTNDAYQGQSTDSTLDDLSSLIRTLRARNPALRVLLAKIVPTSDPDVAARIAELNARIDDFARSVARADSPVISVDQATGFDPEAMTFDGVHPNLDGENHVARRWLEALEPLLARPTADQSDGTMIDP